jgi:hypothetical protein
MSDLKVRPPKECALRYDFAMKECPECEVVNPDTAERCDCGYDFVADPMGSSNTPAKRAIRSILKGIAGVALVIWLFEPVARSSYKMVFMVVTLVLLACFVGLSLLGHAGDMYWWRKKRELKK